MNYFWTVCPQCACEVTIQFADTPGGPSGSLRRWSRDRAVNDGKALAVARGDVAEGGAFGTTCVCGAALTVEPSRVTRATTERPTA